MLSKEQLMLPRYKVIADYPRSAWTVGRIIEGYFLNDLLKSEVDMRKYPAIFKPLEWFEERDVNDLPEYVKPVQAQQYVFKVNYFDGTACSYIGTDGKNKADLSCVFLPATSEEYLTYLN